MNYVREDDIVVVHSMDRLARNLDDLRDTVKSLNSKKVQIKFIKENLTFSDDSSPISNLLLVIMGAFAEFERSIVKERQMEGIILAKKKGLYKGRTKSLNNEQIEIYKRKGFSRNSKSQSSS